MKENKNSEQTVHHHTRYVKEKFEELINHLREDIDKFEDPQAEAMFETAAEVIGGLKQAFDHYEEKKEKAWRE